MKKKLLSNVLFKPNNLDRFNGKNFKGNSNFPKTMVNQFRTLSERAKLVIEGQSGDIPIESLCARENISTEFFSKWTEDFLKNVQGNGSFEKYIPSPLSDDEKYNIVIEGKSGETSIVEICNREKITQDTFLKWCKEFLQYRNKRLVRERNKDHHTIKIRNLIEQISSDEVLKYVESFIDVTNMDTYVCVDGRTDNIIEKNKLLNNIVCLYKTNNIRYINKHFEAINSKLLDNGVFVGCLETYQARKNRLRVSKISILNNFYFVFEFLFKRVFPKLSLTKKYYFDFTKGNDRVLSKAEGLGRLVSCGFKIMDYKSIDGLVYFVVKKEKEPCFDLNPSYGPIYAMPRLGKGGNIINVYKLRTMHPYSEYLQDYVLKANGYAETGKPAHDFRVPAWGKVMRRFWLDEIPQLINVLKGEMKLVGVRPVSKRYFDDIPKEMQKLRQTQKPGCVPPYVALNRDGNVLSVLQSEKDYLVEKLKHPYYTDVKYLISAIYNIVFKHKRSA